MRSEYPAITRAAQEHLAEVYWIGRVRLRGTMPAADVISAVSSRGRVRFMITTPSVDPPLPRDFVLRLSGAEQRTRAPDRGRLLAAERVAAPAAPAHRPAPAAQLRRGACDR